MAPKNNTNRTQKNGVRYALATAATVMTLLGAQSLAFAGKSTNSAQASQTNVASVPTTDSQLYTLAASPTTIPTENTATQAAVSPTATVTAVPTKVQATQITVAATQPAPTSKSSR